MIQSIKVPAISVSDLRYCQQAIAYASSPAVKALLKQTARLAQPIFDSLQSQQPSMERALECVQAVRLSHLQCGSRVKSINLDSEYSAPPPSSRSRRATSTPTKSVLVARDNNMRLTPSLQQTWDALNGKCLTAAELAFDHKLRIGGGGRNTVRKRVLRLRRAGLNVRRKADGGYFRSDAPPSN
jgi:hypothetical protein